MKELRIEFTGRVNRKAKVYLTQEQFERRMYGLIEFISKFADEMEYIIIKPRRKFKTKVIKTKHGASIIRRKRRDINKEGKEDE